MKKVEKPLSADQKAEIIKNQPQKQVTLDIEKMREMSIFLATPMYGGMCHGLYTKSLMETVMTMNQAGIRMQLYYLFNESLITRARNYAVYNFLKSGCTHMLFIDSDISWKAMDLMYMLHLIATNKEKYRIFGALYPKKTIAWEKVLAASKSGVYDNNPNALEKIAGDMVFNVYNEDYPDGKAPVFEPAKVKEIGTGFMFIERQVFEQYGKAHPELWYQPDHLREGEFMPGEQICAYFDTIIHPDSNRYLSEDYMFCQNAQALGINTWALPMIELLHCGMYVYQGKLIDMATIGQHATIDPGFAKQIAEGKMEKSAAIDKPVRKDHAGRAANEKPDSLKK